MSLSTTTIFILLLLLLVLVFLLVMSYKKLNRDTDGKYKIRHVIYKKGGIRDQLRNTVAVLQSRLGVRLGSHSVSSDKDDQEMQVFPAVERQEMEDRSENSREEAEDKESEKSIGKTEWFVKLNQLSGSVVCSDEDANQISAL
nr:uncharacterized protein si:ch211-119e14.1 [Nerophis lumbriciformis]XP_061817137.1 uncharacterized protein si:ch211-119e14.1 [Nerophis lumbriciformis]